MPNSNKRYKFPINLPQNMPSQSKASILVFDKSPKSFKKMELRECPILRPSLQEFNNFYEYIHSINELYKNDFGMVKIVPPNEWKPQSSDYQHLLTNLRVKNAIEQVVMGRSGYYQSRNIVQKQMPYKNYRKYAEKESRAVLGKPIEQREKLFWKTIMYSSPVYGSDLTGSLMDETAGGWNMNNLDSLLRYAMPYRIKGVTQPYCYIGTWKAFFSWHKEDLDLSAINYIHQGEPKVWYSVAAQDSHLLEDCAQKHYRQQYQQCNQFLRHKTFLIHPEVLLKEYPQLRISRATHNAGEIMLVFGGAYHEGFNCGFNIAEAVNYATIDWLGKILSTKPCSCSRKSVKASIQSILYNFEESEMFEELLQLEDFQKIREYVQKQQEAEEARNQTLIDNSTQKGEIPEKIIEQCEKENKNETNIENDEEGKPENKKKTKPIKKKQKNYKSAHATQTHSEKIEPENINHDPIISEL